MGSPIYRPIIFNGHNVCAILDNRKTMTRRVIIPQPSSGVRWGFSGWEDGHGTPIRCPYGQPGDRLWVRETWCQYGDPMHEYRTYYRADGDCGPMAKWRPSIHMPRRASRITLEITGIRVERLQDISDGDVVREGIDEYKIRDQPFPLWQIPKYPPIAFPRVAFASLWDSINAKRGYSWDSNPWVWVVVFKVIKAMRKGAVA
jgi:hypothetical protein